MGRRALTAWPRAFGARRACAAARATPSREPARGAGAKREDAGVGGGAMWVAAEGCTWTWGCARGRRGGWLSGGVHPVGVQQCGVLCGVQSVCVVCDVRCAVRAACVRAPAPQSPCGGARCSQSTRARAGSSPGHVGQCWGHVGHFGVM
eukprot:3117252-Prymnesium_polylepis.1